MATTSAIERWCKELGISYEGEKIAEMEKFLRLFEKNKGVLMPANEIMIFRTERALVEIGILGNIRPISLRKTQHILDALEFDLEGCLGFKLYWDNSSFGVGISEQIGSILHHNVLQRKLHERIRQSLVPHVSPQILEKVRLYGSGMRILSEEMLSEFRIRISDSLRGSPWSRLGYLSLELLDELGGYFVALTFSGQEALAKKVKDIMCLFLNGNFLVDEFGFDHPPEVLPVIPVLVE